jgi:hypothetical protein
LIAPSSAILFGGAAFIGGAQYTLTTVAMDCVYKGSFQHEGRTFECEDSTKMTSPHKPPTNFDDVVDKIARLVIAAPLYLFIWACVFCIMAVLKVIVAVTSLGDPKD